MKESEADFYAGIFFGLWFGIILTSIACAFLIPTDRDMKSQAVERGHAEWIVDPATGKTTWAWREKP